MIITTNILALPLVLLLWFLDAWIILLSARLVLRYVPAAWARRACAAIAPLTDGILMKTHRFACRLWPRLPFPWMGPILLVACLILKQMLLRILIGVA